MGNGKYFEAHARTRSVNVHFIVIVYMLASESRHRFRLLFRKLNPGKAFACYKYVLISYIGSSINPAEDQHFGEQLGNIARVFYCICCYRITRTSLSLFLSLSYSACFTKGNNFYISAFVVKSYLHHPFAFSCCSKSLNFSSTLVQRNLMVFKKAISSI